MAADVVALAMPAPPGRAVAASGGAVHMFTRELEELEAKLMKVLAAHLREASKLQAVQDRQVEARLLALEQRQVRVESQSSEFASALQAVQDRLSSDAVAHPREVPDRHDTSTRESEDEQEMLRQATLQAEALEKQLADAEARAAAERPATGMAAETPLRSGADAPEKSRQRTHGSKSQESAQKLGRRGGTSTSQMACVAVQELEALLHVEIQALHQRFTSLLDTVDERAFLPIKDLEQRLQEQDNKVRSLVGVGQESSAKVEEHEFRLGVMKTKLEVHEQKLSRLEATRWQPGGSASTSLLGACTLDRSGCFQEQSTASFLKSDRHLSAAGDNNTEKDDLPTRVPLLSGSLSRNGSLLGIDSATSGSCFGGSRCKTGSLLGGSLSARGARPGSLLGLSRSPGAELLLGEAALDGLSAHRDRGLNSIGGHRGSNVPSQRD